MTIEIAPVLTVGGSPASATLLQSLLSVKVDRGVNLVGRATLRFLETGYQPAALATFALGTTVVVTLPSGAEIFQGEVTGISLEQESTQGGPATELVVTADDKTYKLGQTTTNRAFLSQTYSQVITTIAGESGLSPEVTSTTETHPYLLQAGSGLSYLTWVTARCGLVWWADESTLKVKAVDASAGTVNLTLGKDLVRFSTRASGRHPGKITVSGWDDEQQASVSYAASATVSQESDLVDKYPGRAAPKGDGVFVADVAPRTAQEAEDIGKSLLAQATAAAVTARGTCLVNGAIKPTATVSVANAGPTSGSYRVTRVEHVYNASGFFTHFTTGPIGPTDLVDLLGHEQPAPGPMMGLMVSAQVTNLDDPDKFGRAKVKFMSMNGAIESWWARIVTLGGGDKRGMVFQPEVGDEVLVGFEQGDTRRPVILGGLHSKQKGLPTSDNVESGKVNYRRITSRLGHVVELADGTSDDKKHILLKTAGGHLIRVGEDKLELTVSKKPVTITNGDAKIEFSDSGDVTIEGNNVTIKAKTGAVKVEAGAGDVQAKGLNVKVESQANLNLKAGGLGAVEATGPLTVKGATVAIN